MQTSVAVLIIIISVVLCCAVVEYPIFQHYLEGLKNLQNALKNLEQQAESIFPKISAHGQIWVSINTNHFR
jgi:predicted AlkP superfamily phosphohydrolase/phosphomutase